MSASQPPRPMYLQGSGTPFFAVLHMAVGPPRETAVLLCPPFGWEDMCTYRIRREWAEHLTRTGHTTLRIDLPGSGDSGGAPADPEQLEAWTQAVEEAARWLRRSGHAGRVAVIGIGLGGMVSCRAALGGAPIDDLVLWSVPARGRTLLRELRAFSALEAANIPVAGEPPRSDPRDEGTVVANGYLLSAETVQELEGLDLQEVEASSRASRRALLLGRDGLKVDGALLGALESAGAAVTVADVQGYGAMMPSEPHEARAPTEVFEFVGSWLGEGEPRGASVATAEHRQTGTRRDGTGTGEDGDLLTPGVPRDRDEIVIRRSGVALRERPILFDGPGGRLFGVLTEPLGIRRELTGVLPNAGFQRRTGPNRMWVEIARRWAVNGVPTLRLDGTGIGDFEGDVTTPGQIAEFYKPLYVEQACAALEMLAERGLPSRFVMLGFCSGAYCSAHAALADERVSVVCMINPRTLIFDEWQWRYTLRHIRHIRESMLLPSTWRKVLRGQIRLDKHFATGRTLVGRAASVSMRARERNVSRRSATREASEPAAREPVADLFDALRDRDQRALLMFTGKEALHRELSQKGVFDDLDRWPNLELVPPETSADTHTLAPLWLQRRVHALVDRVLEDELKRLP
jgi:pimeloyl-ACP methyl ester carboxylesterase